MATFRRERVEGATWFFTVATYRRQRILDHPRSIAALRGALRAVAARHPFSTVAMVILPDHLHAVWELPTGDANFALRWSLIKRVVSRDAGDLVAVPRSRSLHRRSERGFWQRRFWEHRIRDDADRQHHVDYVHFNPVKHRLVANACEWPYSTVHRTIERGDLLPDWGSG